MPKHTLAEGVGASGGGDLELSRRLLTGEVNSALLERRKTGLLRLELGKWRRGHSSEVGRGLRTELGGDLGNGHGGIRGRCVAAEAEAGGVCLDRLRRGHLRREGVG